MNKGYIRDEAFDLITLCVDLNGAGRPSDPVPPVTGWELCFDGHGHGADGGIAPFNNRWKLWKKQGVENCYAMVLRGTIPNAKSITQDLLLTPLDGANIVLPGAPHSGESIQFRLADAEGAAVHMGFTFGMAVLMFHQQQGILTQLRKLPENSQIFITGHSQGAAMTTLAHAFLHRAATDAQEARFGIHDKGFSFKSYAFAQPKPGNWTFAMDFATQPATRDWAYVVNNIHDWVPQVPLSLQSFSKTLEKILTDSRFLGLKWGLRGLRGLDWVRSEIAKDADKITQAVSAISSELDPAYMQKTDAGQGRVSRSFDYMPVGNVLSGSPPADGTPPAGDLMWEHHAVRYREMVKNLA